MKKQITIDQYMELDEEARHKLGLYLDRKHIKSALLNIGQMVEFTEEEGWVEGERLEGNEEFKLEWQAGKACDVLWEGVKEILDD